MTTANMPVLNLEIDLGYLHIQCLDPGLVPTVRVNAGEDISVEIDITRTSAPVSVTVHDLKAASARLCDLFGVSTGRELIRRARTGTDTEGVGGLAFEAGPAWAGLVATAYQEWALFWNPLPMDPSLSALDTVAAAYRIPGFGGAKTARQQAPTALPAVQALERLLEAEQISGPAQGVVRQGIEAVRASLLPGTTYPDTPYTLPLALTATDLDLILTDSPVPEEIGVVLVGSADWRLTGHGPAATAENKIVVKIHSRNPDAITISVPTQPTSAEGPIPIYDAFITEPRTGEIIAHTTLRPTTSGILQGHALPARHVRATDHVDIRHPSLPGTPETNPEQRGTDRARRQAARTLIRNRYKQLDHETTTTETNEPTTLSDIPWTITEHTHTNTLTTATTGDTDLNDLEQWLQLLTSDQVGVRGHGGNSAPTGVTKLSVADPDSGAVVTLLSGPGRPWLLQVTAVRELGPIRLTIRWASGTETETSVVHHSGVNSRVTLNAPIPGDNPKSVKIFILS